jgi:hypothetical protein
MILSKQGKKTNRFIYPSRAARLALMLLLGPLAPARDAFAATCNDQATDNCGTAGTWNCGYVPTMQDAVTIDSHTVTLASGATVDDVTISGGGTLEMSGYQLRLKEDRGVRDAGAGEHELCQQRHDRRRLECRRGGG